MRTEPFKQEIRKIRESLHHAFHDRWRSLAIRTRGEPSLPRHPRVRTFHVTIRDVMHARPVALRPETPLNEALALMLEKRVGGFPVTDPEGRIVGDSSERNLLGIFSEPDAREVGALMTREPASIAVDAPLVEAVDQLMSSDFGRLLVHEDGKLVGVLTRSHVLPAILEVLEGRLHACLMRAPLTMDSPTRH